MFRRCSHLGWLFGLTIWTWLAGISSHCPAESRVGIFSDQTNLVTNRVLEQVQLRLLDAPELKLVPFLETEQALRNTPELLQTQTAYERASLLGTALDLDLVMQMEYVTGRAEPAGFWLRDGRTGSLLDTSSLPQSRPDEIAARLFQSLTQGMSKRTSDKVQTIAFAGVTSSGLAKSQMSAADAFLTALQQRLAGSPGLILAPMVSPRELLSNPELAESRNLNVIASLTLASQDSEVSTSVKLRTPQLSALGETEVTGTGLNVALIQSVANAVCKTLEVAPPPTTVEPRVFAQRYTQEAQYWWGQKELGPAIQAAETALLFEPDRLETVSLLAEILLSDEVLNQLNAQGVGPGKGSLRWTREEVEQFLTRGIELEAKWLTSQDVEFIDFTGQLEPEVFRRMARVRNLLQRLQYDLQIKEVLAPLTDVILESYQEAFEELNEQARNDESMLGRYTSVLHDRLTEISLLFPDYGARAVEDWYDVFGAIPDERKLWTDLATIADAVASMPVNARQQVYRYWLKEFSESQHPLLKLYAEHLELQLAWLFRGPNTESRFEMLRPLRAHAMEVYDQALEQDQLTVAKAVVSLLVKLYDKPFYGARHQSAFPTTRAELMALSQDFLERPLTTTHFVKLLPPLADANTAKAIDQLLNGYLQVCEEHPERLWLTRAAEDEAKQIRELRSLLLRDWPGPLGDQPTIDLRTTLLLDVESFGGQTPIPIYPRALNETLHTLVYRPDVGRRNAVVQLVSVPLKGGKPRMGGVLFHPHSGSYYSMMKNDLTAACVTDQGMFLSSRQYGLVRFDFERPVAEILPLSANLPQEPISALTEVDGTLYAGTRDGSLLRFGILSSEPEILASSRRQQAVTPLDGRPGLQFNELLHDAPRKRLLIVLHDDPNRVNELWSMTLDDLEFQRLLTIPNVNQPPDAWLNGETLILARDWIVRWDLAKDQGSLTGSYALGDLSPTRELALPFVRRVAFCQDAIWWLAQTGGLYHLSPGTDPPQAHFPDFGGKRENSPGSDANYLSSIDDWRFLASYNGRVWLVEPQLGNSDNSNQEKTPTQ